MSATSPDPSDANVEAGVASPVTATAPSSAPPTVPVSVAPAVDAPRVRAWSTWIAVASMVVAAAAATTAWHARSDSRVLERELVRRQTESQAAVIESRTLAKAAEEAAREAQAKTSLLEARVSESAAQHVQVESLVANLSKTRDEHLVSEIDVLLRAASHQAAWSGRAEPLLLALKQSEERLASQNSPRTVSLRRALARDAERISALGIVDPATLAQRVDDVLRQVDELALVQQAPLAGDRVSDRGERAASAAAPGKDKPSRPSAVAAAAAAAMSASAPEALPAGLPGSWREAWQARWVAFKNSVLEQARSLVRVSRIDQPQAMLLAPEQAYFVRENLRLRLLSARLALLTRQQELAQSDLREALKLLETYFDTQSRKVSSAADRLKQVAATAKVVPVPRPDESLAALSTLVK